MPVLFQRIACEGQANIEWQNGKPQNIPSESKRAIQASYTYAHITQTGEQNDLLVSEKWGGTYGNKLTVCIRSSNNVYWMDIKYNGVLVEKVKIMTLKGNESPLERKRLFIEAINKLELEKVTLEILCPIDETTHEYEYDKFEIPIVVDPQTNVPVEETLVGGTDFEYDLVKAEIKSMYDLVKDKILYQPKFITSGGYTDEEDSVEIGSAMENLTMIRQDCRAIIDLPLGTTRDDYQTSAENYSYSQLASTTPIPSASVFGPWLYMQVGNDQIWMPPSYAYLTVIGNAVSKGEKVYTPKAGLVSGRILNIIKPEFEIGNDICEEWQKAGKTTINPIMKLQSNDYIIAGNSTLLRIDEDETNAFSESSVDLAVIEIRRFIYNLASELQYQYNNASAFEKFSIKTSTYFEGMVKQGAVTDYAIANISTDDDPRTLKVKVNVLVTPSIKAIEIYLNVAYGSITLNAGGEV